MSDVPELQFMVLADLSGTPEGLVQHLLANLAGSVQVSSKKLEWPGNRIEVDKNEDHDPSAADDAEDGFLAYHFRIEVWPTQVVDEDHQINLARLLREQLTELGARAEVCAEFEDRL